MTKWVAVLAFIAAASIGPALAQGVAPLPVPNGSTSQRAMCESSAQQLHQQHIMQCKTDAACIRAADAKYQTKMRACANVR